MILPRDAHRERMMNSVYSWTRRGFTAPEIAEKLDCCTRTVGRYRRMLREAGRL